RNSMHVAGKVPNAPRALLEDPKFYVCIVGLARIDVGSSPRPQNIVVEVRFRRCGEGVPRGPIYRKLTIKGQIRIVVSSMQPSSVATSVDRLSQLLLRLANGLIVGTSHTGRGTDC